MTVRTGIRLVWLPVALFAAAVLAAPAHAAAPGPNNAITDVPGVQVGHDTKKFAGTGTTVLVMPSGALMGSSPSGGAPGNRVTTLLHATYQDDLRTPIFGILLNGGSIFGLQAACGVVEFLQEKGLGIQFGNRTIPLVPGAIIFDLGRGRDAQQGDDVIPDQCANGYRAASNARDGRVAEGSVGAGTGARSGGIKGGVGTASMVLDDGTVIGALVVVNSVGRPYNQDDDCSLYTLYLEQNDEFGRVRRPPSGCETDVPFRMAPPGQHTTIGVIATNARLSAAQVERLAQDADDGFARAIRPAHTAGDGDTIYGLSTAVPNDVAGSAGVDGGKFTQITVQAADVYSRAITHAIINATNLDVAETYCERFPSACPGSRKKGAAVGAPRSGATVGGGGASSEIVGLTLPLAASALLLVLLAGAFSIHRGRAAAGGLGSVVDSRKPAPGRSTAT
jgi:L-aminopeptidase/D-esterase-like protein